MAHAYSPRRNVVQDLPLALLVHGGLVAAVLTTRLGAPPTFDARPTLDTPKAVFWLTPPLLESRPPQEPDVAVEPSPEQARDGPRAEPEQNRPSAATRNPSPATPEGAEPDASVHARPPPAIDWERERRAALDQLRAEPRRGYATFSADDFIAPPAPPAERAPTGEIFAPNAQGPSLLALGQQHTRFGRKLADICHALTGGFGVSLQGHALFSLCAASGGRSDLFAAIKPEYLNLVPDCTTDLPREVTEQIPPTLVRCRLVAPAGESSAPVPE